MKIKHIWSVLCKESSINQDDNLISMSGALEEINVTFTKKNEVKYPENLSVPMNYEIVSFWFKGKKEELVKAQIEYSLISPDGKELVNKIQDIEIPINIRRFRSRMKIAGLPVTISGDYTFRVKLKEESEKTFKLYSELPLEVKIQSAPSKIGVD